MDFKLLFENLIKLYPNNKRICVIVKETLYQEYCKENDILDKQQVSIDNHEITIICSKTPNTPNVTVIPIQDDKQLRFKHYRYTNFIAEARADNPSLPAISCIDTCPSKINKDIL